MDLRNAEARLIIAAWEGNKAPQEEDYPNGAIPAGDWEHFDDQCREIGEDAVALLRKFVGK